jgi:glycosyltransferase involved in cell wall biosynthesis
MEPSTKLSIVVLTYNEEKRLRECLASVAGCGELVVIDGYSTDGTVAIAREFTDKVFLSDRLGPKNPGGFSAQRNFGLEQATGDWVFFLDADERFSPELLREVQEFCAGKPDPACNAYLIPRKEHFFGVHTPYTHGEGWQRRFVRKGSGSWDDRLVHEGFTTEGRIGLLMGYLMHYSKDSIADYLATQNRYTTLEAEQGARDNVPFPLSPWKAMIKTFLNTYVYKGSYREGAFGLIMSLLFTQATFLVWAKRWEIEQKAERIPAEAPRSRWFEFGAKLLRKIWRVISPPPSR